VLRIETATHRTAFIETVRKEEMMEAALLLIFHFRAEAAPLPIDLIGQAINKPYHPALAVAYARACLGRTTHNPAVPFDRDLNML